MKTQFDYLLTKNEQKVKSKPRNKLFSSARLIFSLLIRTFYEVRKK